MVVVDEETMLMPVAPPQPAPLMLLLRHLRPSPVPIPLVVYQP